MFEIVTQNGPELERKTAKLPPRVYIKILDTILGFILSVGAGAALVLRDYFFAGLCVVVLAGILLSHLRAWKKQKRSHASVMTSTVTIRADEMVVEFSDAKRKVVSLDQIKAVYDADSTIIFEVDDGLVVMDKAGFQKGTPEDLLSFLEPKTARRTKVTRTKHLLRGLAMTLLPLVFIVLYFVSGFYWVEEEQK